MKLLLVNVTVWFSVAFWCLGARLWLHARRNADERRRAGVFWLAGAALLLIHIVASYGFVHRWSHADALRVTAEQSVAVTGVAAPWGVYVNFVFAAAWLAVSLHLLKSHSNRRLPESIFYWFSVLMVGSATIFFKEGPIRWFSAAAFGWLMWDTYRGSSRHPEDASA